mgnify:CR=1 FL=1
MKRHLALVVVIVLFGPGSLLAQASWIFQPSYFSHSPATGQRVVQYAPAKPALARSDTTYQQSAYRHSRSSIRVGDSSDHLHIVETWGAGEYLRPYGEWLRPFREGATPFGPWGNPQGPWTTPFGSWVNPYGLGRLPHPPWGHWYPGYYPAPYPVPLAPPATPPATGAQAPAAIDDEVD